MPRKGAPWHTKEHKATAVAYARALKGQKTQEVIAQESGLTRRVLYAALRDPEIVAMSERKRRELGLGMLDMVEELLNQYRTQIPDANLTNKGVDLLRVVSSAAQSFTSNTEAPQVVVKFEDGAIKQRALDLFERYVVAMEGDREAAKMRFAEKAPELAPYLP